MNKVQAIYVANNQQLKNIEITPLRNGKYLANGSTFQSASLKKILKRCTSIQIYQINLLWKILVLISWDLLSFLKVIIVILVKMK